MMVNQEIITALKNAVDRGQDLRTAIQICINSGYNPQEVYEASNFISGGVLNITNFSEKDQLLMPEQRKILKKKEKNALKSSLKNDQRLIKNQVKSLTPIKKVSNSPVPDFPLVPPTTEELNQNNFKLMREQLNSIKPHGSPVSVNQSKTPHEPNTSNNLKSQNVHVLTQTPPLSPSPLPKLKKLPNTNHFKSSGNISKKDYLKEIFLLIILLILIGVLVITIIFREKIISWFI